MTESTGKNRQEFKYLLSAFQAALIESALCRHGLLPDPFSSPGAYAITSLYFDTPELSDYYDKLGGLARRRKLRARSYGENLFHPATDAVWLENKEKDNMLISKSRVRISPESLRDFCGPQGAFDLSAIYDRYKDNERFRRFAFFFLRGNYKPHALVRYRRRAFEGVFRSEFRVTLDRELEACRYNGFQGMILPTLVAPGKVVMEVKFIESLPWWFRTLLETFHLSRTAFSKYANSVDALHALSPLPR